MKTFITNWRFGLCCAVMGFLATIFLNRITELVPVWGEWYSRGNVFRLQTDSFFRGHLSLSHSPYMLANDLVWDNGNVQQVWGLGVPALQFVFNLVAKVFGFQRFPDRIVFLIAYFVVATFVIHTLAAWPRATPPDDRSMSLLNLMQGFCAAALILFCPAFVTLSKTTFMVYEEVVAYGYLYAILLFALLLLVAKNPSNKRVLVLSGVAGLGPAIRPTLLFYSLVTLALLLYIECKARMRRRVLVSSILAFCMPVLFLCYLNWLRFGGIAEFGHTLNLSPGDHNMFSLKFGCPWEKEHVVSAAMDTIGSLFFVKCFNGSQYYDRNLYLWQSPTYHWHSMYFSTFDLSYLSLFMFGTFIWLLRFKHLSGAYARIRFGDNRDGEANPAAFSKVFTSLAMPWAVCSFLGLFAFYIRSPSVASRYSVDFAAAMIVGIAAAVSYFFELARRLPRNDPRAVGTFICVAILGGLAYEIDHAQIEPAARRHHPFYYAEIGRSDPKLIDTNVEGALRGYRMGEKNLSPQILDNGLGWNLKNGELMPSVILFASDPECVILSLSVGPGSIITKDDLSQIRAKIGLEYLSLESTSLLSLNTATIVFGGPTKQRYKKGIQVCFLRFISPDHLGLTGPSVRLTNVSFSRQIEYESEEERRTFFSYSENFIKLYCLSN